MNTVILFMIILFLIITTVSYENWSNTFSGIPGPIENGNGNYNIPALYGRGRQFESKMTYKYGLNKNSTYMSMRGYPE